MASFPTAVKAFATHVTNEVIQAAHINDLQDEVAAIEDGLLNGTAGLVSSNVTFNRLTVNATSTFTGNVQFNGTASSFSGNVVVGGTMAVTGASSFAGAMGVEGAFTANGMIARRGYQGIQLPAGNTDNAVLQSSAAVVEMTSTAGSTVTGFAGGVLGRSLSLINAGVGTIVLANQSGGSASSNQFVCPRLANLTLQSGCGVDIYYAPAALWRVVAGSS